MVGVEIQFFRDPSDFGHGSRGREEASEVENGIDDENPARRRIHGGTAQQDLFPRNLEGELSIGLNRRVAATVEKIRELTKRILTFFSAQAD